MTITVNRYIYIHSYDIMWFISVPVEPTKKSNWQLFHYNHRLNDNAMTSLNGKGKTQCMAICDVTEGCLSMNYNRGRDLCELNSSTEFLSTSDLVPSDGYNYYQRV